MTQKAAPFFEHAHPIIIEVVFSFPELVSAYKKSASYGFLTPCLNLEKTNDLIPRKRLERRTDGWKDRQTLFHRTLLASAVGPIIATYLRKSSNKLKIPSKIFTID